MQGWVLDGRTCIITLNDYMLFSHIKHQMFSNVTLMGTTNIIIKEGKLSYPPPVEFLNSTSGVCRMTHTSLGYILYKRKLIIKEVEHVSVS